MNNKISLWTAVALFLPTLAGCATQTQAVNGLPWQLEQEEVALDRLPAPEELGAFRYKGEIDSPQTRVRVLRYTHKEHGHRMDLSLYPMPPGWDTMDPERTVAGHYAEIQDSITQRALDRGAREVAVTGQELHPPGASGYPVLSSKLEQVFEGGNRIAFVELTAWYPILFHGAMVVPEGRTQNLSLAIHEAVQVYLRAMEEAEDEAGVVNRRRR